ncbi:zinc finger MYND domain-containing protein 12 [Latimeria chalumnae]|nr:PREDICTED: zinc finger MYND domain-containing protein 12 [Latimeria chalumnae]|eukprot:XP_005994058.1 PREDICTED: zinc finger MYND domain-containing protein 12 [Latimeria chalumnae]
MDWVSIHQKICQLLIPVRTALPFFNSEEERQHSRDQLLQREKHLIELTSTVARKLIFEGKHEEAIPAALQSLRFSINVHGVNSVQLVPSYLLLSEASIGLGRHTRAEEYLSQAQWTVLKAPDCDYRVRHILSRNLGLLYAAKGEFEEALFHLADDIYLASEVFGLKSIQTSGGYFQMANIFFRQSKMDVADSLYTEVTDIWHAHLSKLIKMQLSIRDQETASQISTELEDTACEVEALDEAQEAEAAHDLNAILDVREQAPHKEVEKIAKVSHVLAMLYFLITDLAKAGGFCRKALQGSRELENKEWSTILLNLLALIKSSAASY